MKTLTGSLVIGLMLAFASGCEQADENTQAAAEDARVALQNAAEESGQLLEQAGQELDQALQEVGSSAPSEQCATPEDNEGIPAALDEDTPSGAIAILYPTAQSSVRGTVHFRPTGDGLAIKTTATKLSPGEHGYHIHLYGDCAAPDATSAGPHFNLQGSSLNPPQDIDRITGNLGTLLADQNGNAEATGSIQGASLTGPKSIIGRAVIVHAQANDPAQPPDGGAGARVACGVIGIADPAASP